MGKGINEYKKSLDIIRKTEKTTNNIVEKVNNNEIPPRCDNCHGILRPDVIMFGDMLPEDFNIALEEVENSDLLIVIGSSLVVAPVNYLPQMAKKLIIINSDSTAMDFCADLIINESASAALEAILYELKVE